MPTYDYVCEACGHEFEHFQSMSDKRLRTCPKCKKPALVRRVGAGAGVIFRGSGFYQTDYKQSGSSSKAGTPPSDAKDSSSAGSSSGSPASGGGGCGAPACGDTAGTCASDAKPAKKKKGD
jgi:putative FmdB family regulatory protein